MIPVVQTDTTPGTGNCLAACIASILELPLEEVPNPHTPDWQAIWRDWLRRRGLSLLTWEIPEDYTSWSEEELRAHLPGYCMVAVDSPRFAGKLHSVVTFDGQVVHDPHPDGLADHYDFREVDLLIALDPRLAMVPCMGDVLEEAWKLEAAISAEAAGGE